MQPLIVALIGAGAVGALILALYTLGATEHVGEMVATNATAVITGTVSHPQAAIQHTYTGCRIELNGSIPDKLVVWQCTPMIGKAFNTPYAIKAYIQSRIDKEGSAAVEEYWPATILQYGPDDYSIVTIGRTYDGLSLAT